MMGTRIVGIVFVDVMAQMPTLMEVLDISQRAVLAKVLVGQHGEIRTTRSIFRNALHCQRLVQMKHNRYDLAGP